MFDKKKLVSTNTRVLHYVNAAFRRDPNNTFTNPTQLLIILFCHTRFQKEDQMYHICAPGSSFTHLEDIISEYIKDNVQSRKQKEISTLLHTLIDRHDGLNVSPITYL